MNRNKSGPEVVYLIQQRDALDGCEKPTRPSEDLLELLLPLKYFTFPRH